MKEEREYTVQHYKDVIRLAHDWESPTVMWLAGWFGFGTLQKDAWNYIERFARDFKISELYRNEVPSDYVTRLANCST